MNVNSHKFSARLAADFSDRAAESLEILFMTLPLVAGLLLSQPASAAASEGGRVSLHIMHIQMGGSDTFHLLESELQKPYADQQPEVSVVPLPTDGRNPFILTGKNFQTGKYRPNPGQPQGLPPIETPNDASWFQEQIERNTNPQMIYLGGHHIPGMGFHSDDMMDHSEDYYMRSLYFPSLVQSFTIYPEIQNFFKKVKIVILGGCWSLANLEPHGPKGEYLSPEEIKSKYDSGEEGKREMVGDASRPHTLGYQRNELTTIYGGDFSDGPSAERCGDNTTGKNCATFNANRTLPDYGLYDGSHSFNMPYQYKRLFPNAVLVMGFHRPSPMNDVAAGIYRKSFADGLIKLNQYRKGQPAVRNLLLFIMDETQPLDQRKFAIQAIREAWTVNSFKMNRGRSSGSITPAFPDLDANGPFLLPSSFKGAMSGAPAVAPYESR